MAGLLTANGLIDIIRRANHVVSGASPIAATSVGTGWRLLLGWPLFLIAACGIAMVDGRLIRHGTPSAARTALLAIVPLLLTVLVNYPVAEEHPVHWTQLSEALLAGVEGARWTRFGVALHLVLPRFGDRSIRQSL